MSSASPRRAGLSVRDKLLLLSVVPVVVTAGLLFALFLWGYSRTAAAYGEALEWQRHSEALGNLDWAARLYVDSVADGIVQDPMPHHSESQEKLAKARSEALVLSKGFSVEEQTRQALVDAHLAALVDQGERVGKNRDRLRALEEMYRNVIDPEIRRRIEEEAAGGARAAQTARHVSDAVYVGGSAVAFVVLLAAILATVVAIRGFGRRVASLQTAAARVAAGDLEENVPITSRDELGRLAGSLNLMIEALRSQRTRQLGFLAAVAHDLRNPLGAMSLSTQVLLEKAEASSDSALRKSLALIERQIERLSRMSNDLLDAASIEAGQLKLEERFSDITAVARDVAELHSRTSPQHDLRLSVPAEPVELVCDPTRIAQMLDNLVNNAIKYSPTGGSVEVAVATAVQEVVLSVADEGVGIDPNMSEAIFEPFRRLPATKDVRPGVGLGLSICRRIVAAHGGRIVVASKPGQGTKFEVHLPRRPASATS